MTVDTVGVVSTDLLRWIVLFPLLGAIVNGILVRPKSSWVSGSLASLFLLASFVLSVVLLGSRPEVFSGQVLRDSWFEWFSVGRVVVPFDFELTGVTAIMLLVITGIGFLIHVFATGYMSHEKNAWRFFSYLNLFVTAMLVLVLSRSLVGVFLGWEGVGLCSYLLIGYWFQDPKNSAAGMKAFLVNRIGDLGFLISLFVVFAFAGTANVSDLIALATGSGSGVPAWAWTAFAFGLLWASTGKSAQVPLYVWLPDAMAGPTPVSALIHAATMVTSGVVVVTRLWPVFATQELVLHVMLIVGLVTAWLGALVALRQNDIKKVLAYSTVSQLGLMFVALGLGSPTAAMFHVVTHACFKALLFLGAGSVIHGVHEQQDLRVMGGLAKKMPITHWTFAAGTAAIIGFPLTSGFFSKDLILAKAYEQHPIWYALVLGAALLTAFYMLRLYALAFLGEARSSHAKGAQESGPWMAVPLVFLASLSLVVGWFETPPIIGGIHLFKAWVESSWGGWSTGGGHALSHLTEWILVIVTTGLSLGVAAWSLKKYRHHSSQAGSQGFALLDNKFYVDEIYDRVFVRPLSAAASFSTKWVDQVVVNGVGHVLRDSVKLGGNVLSLFHTGNLQTYFFYALLGLVMGLLALGWIFV